MFEHRHQPLLPGAKFLRRILLHASAAFSIVLGSLVVGTLGYHFIAALTWTDAFMNAAMLLGGMGPVNELHTASAKIFAACYALYAGIVFLVVAGILIAPLFHRFLHRFHLELDEDDADSSSR